MAESGRAGVQLHAQGLYHVEDGGKVGTALTLQLWVDTVSTWSSIRRTLRTLF